MIFRHTNSTQPQFTLPSFLPRLANTVSHSLPASPSRLPSHSGFTAPGLRFYPLGMQSPSTEALALESRRQRLRENDGEMAGSKKPRLSNESSSVEHSHQSISVQKPVIMTPTQSSLISTQPGMTCFPLTQATPIRYPFMPVLTHSMLPTAPRAFAPPITIAERKEEENEEHYAVDKEQ